MNISSYSRDAEILTTTSKPVAIVSTATLSFDELKTGKNSSQSINDSSREDQNVSTAAPEPDLIVSTTLSFEQETEKSDDEKFDEELSNELV